MYLETCTATRLYNRRKGCVAWNLTTEERAALKRRTSNAYGATMTFEDGSQVFVPKGSASVIVRRVEGGRFL